MKYYFTFLLAVLLSAQTIAQNHFIGAFAGLNVATINTAVFGKFKPGAAAGVTYELRFGEILNLNSGVLFNQRGAVAEVTVPSEGNQNILAANAPFTANYVSMPLMIGLASKGSTYLLGRIGAVASIGLNSYYRVPEESSEPNAGERIDLSEDFGAFDMSAAAEIGLGGQVGDRMKLEGTLGFQYGMTDVYDTGNLSAKSPHMGFTLGVALKFGMGASETSN